jgi:hypothetical protein
MGNSERKPISTSRGGQPCRCRGVLMGFLVTELIEVCELKLFRSSFHSSEIPNSVQLDYSDIEGS